MLSRLEDEAEREQEALRLRIDEETVELKATMTFSRASVVASVEQEVRRSMYHVYVRQRRCSLPAASVCRDFKATLNFLLLCANVYLAARRGKSQVVRRAGRPKISVPAYIYAMAQQQ